MTESFKVGGYLYWKLGYKELVVISERIPVESPSPEPKGYLEKIPLAEQEMGLSLLILEKRYPFTGEVPAS